MEVTAENFVEIEKIILNIEEPSSKLIEIKKLIEFFMMKQKDYVKMFYYMQIATEMGDRDMTIEMIDFVVYYPDFEELFGDKLVYLHKFQTLIVQNGTGSLFYEIGMFFKKIKNNEETDMFFQLFIENITYPEYKKMIVKSRLEDLPYAFDEVTEFYEKMNDQDKLIKVLQKGSEFDWVGSIFKLADYHQNVDHNYEKMLELYEKLMNERIYRAFSNVLVFYTKNNQYEKAIQIYLRFIEIEIFTELDRRESFKQVTCALCDLGILYQKIGDEENSIKYYLKAISRGNGMAMNNYADILEKKGDFENAQKYYLNAIKHNCFFAYFSLATFHQNIDNNYDKAEENYILAIQHDVYEAIIPFAQYYELIEKNYELALQYYQMAFDHKQDFQDKDISVLDKINELTKSLSPSDY